MEAKDMGLSPLRASGARLENQCWGLRDPLMVVAGASKARRERVQSHVLGALAGMRDSGDYSDRLAIRARRCSAPVIEETAGAGRRRPVSSIDMNGRGAREYRN
ncbi:MAG: hypothetical protein HC927_06490 [Deltaproteobacteria bacterium]|nr:hypothetical protein [Deltaproteobacteria bacterium]